MCLSDVFMSEKPLLSVAILINSSNTPNDLSLHYALLLSLKELYSPDALMLDESFLLGMSLLGLKDFQNTHTY